MARINNKFQALDSNTLDGAGTNYIVQTVSGSLYSFHGGLNDNSDYFGYQKSTNNGYTWSNSVPIASSFNFVNAAIWYDRWSGLNSDLIHIVYQDNSNDDIFYRTLNTSNDTLSSPVTIYNGSTTAGNNYVLSVTRAKGGNIAIAFNANPNGTINEKGFAVSSSSWNIYTGSSLQNPFRNESTYGAAIILPEQGSSDDQDLCLIHWDRTATTLTKQHWDNSALTWITSSISTGMTFQNAGTVFPIMSAVPDNANNQNILIAFKSPNLGGNKLQCWILTSSSITTKTDVIPSATNVQGACALSLDTTSNTWYAYYNGLSSGFYSGVNIFYKTSTNQGTTWSSEIPLTTDVPTYMSSSNNNFGSFKYLVPIPLTSDLNPIIFFGEFWSANYYLFGANLPLFTDGGSIVVT
jgi:hypothetical protein